LPKINGPPLELEPLARQMRVGRETVRQPDPARAVSMSPSARQSDLAAKRAQYEQVNAEYLALMSREASKQKKQAKWDEGPKQRADRLPSLPVAKTIPVAADERPSARTPPPTHAAPLSNRASARLPDDGMSRSNGHGSGSGGGIPSTFAGDVPMDVDDGYMSEQQDEDSKEKKKHNRIRVIVRKRPLNEKEGGEDCLIVENNAVNVNATKLRVDLTEYQEKHHYSFDAACSDDAGNRDVYEKCGRELITTVFEGGSASCFAYGQTGSGKTHTMMGGDIEPGLYVLAAEDIFARCQENHRVFVSLYEIYCNSLFDLLNQRSALHAREDANKRINICGLTWHEIKNVKDLLRVIDRGTLQRRTGSTSANEFSSRSHAVMTISLRDEDQPKFFGCLNVVDLAGSERAADTAANDKQTRLEGAEINKSLLALKECIRGLDEGKKHIQFRGSKLTEVLRDSFVGNSRTMMIATVSPSSVNAEHTLNTLRYAFRVKGLSFDCPMPSKERNAPRPTQRSKSTDVEAANRRIEKELKEKEKKKRGHKKRTPRHPLAVDGGGDINKLVEDRVRVEMTAMREEQRRSNEMIQQLVEQLNQLRVEQNQLRKHPGRLPPLSAGDDDGASGGLDSRPRSEKASRRSRRKHRELGPVDSANHSPTKAALHSVPVSGRRGDPRAEEEMVTLEELLS
jgi:kinesin family protein 2/24